MIAAFENKQQSQHTAIHGQKQQNKAQFVVVAGSKKHTCFFSLRPSNQSDLSTFRF